MSEKTNVPTNMNEHEYQKWLELMREESRLDPPRTCSRCGKPYSHKRAGFSIYQDLDMCPTCEVIKNCEDNGITDPEEQKQRLERAIQFDPYLFED